MRVSVQHEVGGTRHILKMFLTFQKLHAASLPSFKVKNAWCFPLLPHTSLPSVRFDIFTALRMMFFRVLVPCRLITRCQRFGVTYCLLLSKMNHDYSPPKFSPVSLLARPKYLSVLTILMLTS